MKHLFILLITTLVTNIIYSQPGTIDETFGNNGFAADDGISATYIVVQQSDGKLLTAGGYNDQEFNGKGNLARFLLDGTLDSSFGKNGFAGNPPGGGISGIVLQKDGKFVEVGLLIASQDHTNSTNFVARLKQDGTFDSSFGVNGFCFIPDFADASGYSQIAMQTDGSFIINGAGQTNLQNQQPTYSLLCHLFSDGTFDYSFGNGGRALNKSLINYNRNGALAIQPDGKILQAGFNDGGGYQYRDYVLCRYGADGSPDETFGNAGVVVTQGINGEDIPNGLVVQPDGKIVMGGYSGGNNNTYYMAAIRYNTDGSLDNSFGNKGKSFVLFPERSAYATALLRQEDGRLILSGWAVPQGFTNSDIAVCRLNADGSIDSGFAINGRQLASYAGSPIAQGYCATLQSDGKIVTGGSYYDNERGYESYLLVRFNGDKQQRPLVARVKRWLSNHGIGWQGLDANINYYSVQYSKTGSGFSEKGTVSGWGSSQFKQYDYDVNDAGYYRVVAVDGKGYKTFSNKVLVSGAEVASAASVYPNPARNYITVQGLPVSGAADISIRDGSGNVLARGMSTGSIQYRSQLGSNMQPGMYYVNITTGSKTETLTFVKE